MSEDELTVIFGDLTVVQLIVWVIAAGTFLVLVVKLWPALVKFVATMNALDDLPGKLTLVDEIHHEVRPNTGTSLNDSVRRVEAVQQQQSVQLNTQDERLIELAEKLTGLEKLMEDGDSELAARVDDMEATLNPGKGK